MEQHTICNRPHIGVDVLAGSGSGVLVGVRYNSGSKPALPGGKLESAESIGECAVRELFEETGLRGVFAGILAISENAQDVGGHYVNIIAHVHVDGNPVPEEKEPSKIGGWRWAPVDQDFSNLFLRQGEAVVAVQKLLNTSSECPWCEQARLAVILPGVSTTHGIIT